MTRKGQSINAEIPDNFNTNIENLPHEFVTTMGKFALYIPRFELLISLIMNGTSDRIDPKVPWSEKGQTGTRKWLKAMRGIPDITEIENKLIKALEAADNLYNFRNEMTHACIRAFDENGELFLQRINTNKEGLQSLEWGIYLNMREMESSVDMLINWCRKTGQLLEEYSVIKSA